MTSLPHGSSKDHLLERVPRIPELDLGESDFQAHGSYLSPSWSYPSPAGTPLPQFSPAPSFNSVSSETVVSCPTPKLLNVKIVHLTPSEVMSPTYYRHEFHPYKPESSLVKNIRPLQCQFERRELPVGWGSLVSPEGNLYFINEEKSVVTLTNIAHARRVEARYIDAAITQIRDRIDEAKFPEHTDLVVALADHDSNSSGNEPTVGYYLANWSHQVITWLDGEKTSQICQEGRAMVSEPHLELKLRAQFWLDRSIWTHARIFPNHRALPANAIQEFKDVLAVKLSNGINPAALAQLSSMIHEIKDGEPKPVLTLLASQSLQQTYEERFLSAWGEPGSQLDRSGSTSKKDGPEASFFFSLIAVFFLLIPHIYLRKLRASFDKDNVHYLLWKRSYAEMRQHWGTLVIPTTVLFSGTLGFITISDFSQMRTPAQIVAVIVVILDFFVIIVTYLLKNAKDTDDMLKYIYDRRRSCMGLEGVAILFSLPVACFILSVAVLIGDAAWVFFSNSTLQMKIALGLLVAVLLLLVILLVPFTLKPTMDQEQVSKLMDKLVEYIDRTFRPNSNN